MLNVMNKPIRTLLIMLCAAAVLLAAAQETTTPALPPEAQQAFDRGLKAVKQQAWGLAARYFSEAQMIAPYASTVLFNLGLAHARAGHELPAIAWLQAYLAATPQAPNAEAVRAEIERLKTVARGKMNTIFQTAITAAQQLSDNDVLGSISYDQAAAGDMEGAIATAELTTGQEATPKVLNEHWSWFSQKLEEDGDLEGAREAFENVNMAEAEEDDFLIRIFYLTLPLYGGNDGFEAARNAAQKIHGADLRGKLLREVRVAVLEKIVDENAREGDFDPIPIEELLSLLEYDSWRISRLLSIAEQQGKFKDAEGKSQTINRALKLARAEQKPHERARLLAHIARALSAQGESSSAKAIAKEMLACGEPAWGYELDEKKRANIKVIDGYNAMQAYAILGNVSEALALIRRMKHDAYYKQCYNGSALIALIYTQAMSGDLEGAKKTETIAASILDSLDDTCRGKETGQVRTSLARAQLEKGDPAGALETLKQIRVADYYFNEYFNETCGKIFNRLMTEGQVSKAMEVTKLIGEVARRKEKVSDPAGAAREYVREMGLIQMQATVGDKAGRPEAAQGTTDFAHASNWIALAMGVSAGERTGDLKKALKDAATVEGLSDRDRIKRLAEVAQMQGRTLNKISALERKSGRERGGK